MSKILVSIQKLYEDAVIPEYATEGSAGFDLMIHNFKTLHTNHIDPSIYIPQTNFSGQNEIMLHSQERLLVGCGFAIELPQGRQLEVRTRSGLAINAGLAVLNSPGTVDSDYRGEVGVILINTSKNPILLRLGAKIAQGVITDYFQAHFDIVKELTSTQRGSGGFGHSGN